MLARLLVCTRMPVTNRDSGARKHRTVGEQLNRSPTVVHASSLKPLDEARLVEVLGGHDLVVTVEEHSVHAGLGGLVAEVLTASGTAPRVERIGIDDVWGESADNAYLLDLHGLSAERLVERIRSSVPAGARR